MAYGYGTTHGVGTTDKVVSSLTAHATQRTYSMWSFRTGNGGNGLGRYMDKRTSGAEVEVWFDSNTNTTMEYSRQFSGGASVWQVTRQPLNAWHHNVITYDSSSLLNDPAIYRDGVALSVTNFSRAASGTANTNAEAYVIGNRGNDNARVWEGWHAEFAVWNVILGADEIESLAQGISPLLIRPGSLLNPEYLPMVRDRVSLRRAAPSVTGTRPQAHPRIYLPRRRSIIFVPAATATTVSPGKASLVLNGKSLTIQTPQDTTVGPISKAALRLNMKAVNTNTKREFTKSALRINGKGLSVNQIQEIGKAVLRFTGKGLTNGGALIFGKATLLFNGKAVSEGVTRSVGKAALRINAKALQIAAPLFVTIGKAALRFNRGGGMALTIAGGALRAVAVSFSRFTGAWRSLVSKDGGVGGGGVNAKEEP
jgi:hypothetical protein